MAWSIMAFIIGAGGIAQLRFLCLSQNNGYILPRSKKLIDDYLPIAISVFIVFILGVLSYLFNEKINIAGLVFSILFFIYEVVKNITYRTKFNFTKRGMNYFISCEFVYILIIILLGFLLRNSITIVLSICPVILAIPLIMQAIFICLNLIYNHKNKKFIYEQKRRLSLIKPIIIGITGSYGKTSCKNILKHLIDEEFVVCTTEKNYNTPMGIAISISKMKGNEQIFIAEFGARKMGDIAELCGLFPPYYGLLTGVCGQHLEYFKSLENIIMEKSNLVKTVEKNGGISVFNTNDKNVINIWKEYKGRKISVSCCKKSDIYANNIKISPEGSTFDLNINKKTYKCKTALLGKHNIQNIAMCVGVAIALGCDLDSILKKIETLPQIPHRLQYLFANGVHILDDSYNGNIVGIKSSLEVLKYFPNRHVVVAQGIVELGTEAELQNEKVGMMLSSVAEIVILSGVNVKYIQRGLNNTNYSGRVIVAKNFKEVKKLIKETIKKGDTLLLQNDIPDIY